MQNHQPQLRAIRRDLERRIGLVHRRDATLLAREQIRTPCIRLQPYADETAREKAENGRNECGRTRVQLLHHLGKHSRQHLVRHDSDTHHLRNAPDPHGRMKL